MPVAAAVAAIAVLTGSNGSPGMVDPTLPALAEPLPQVELGTDRRPENVALADAEGLALRLPFPRDVVTAIAFHPVETSGSVALDPRGGVDHEVIPRRGRSGPETAALDVGAPAGTAVYAPVSGVVAVVRPYEVAGKEIGYEMAIAPAAAAGLFLRITHLDAPRGFDVPRVGDPVTAGVTRLGRVADFSAVVDQEISQYTNDSGNHVHMEVLRAGAGA